jgi:COG4 transport protein
LQVPRVVSLFVATRGLTALVSGTPASAGAGPALDPVAVDKLLSELRGLLACCQEFVAFLRRTAVDAVRPKPEPRALNEALRGGQYAHATHELQAAYVSLERVYLERSIAKAIELDTVTEVRRTAQLPAE